MRALYRTDELRRREHRGRASLPAGTLMQRAGEAAAQAIDAFWRATRTAAGRSPSPAAILLQCGPGDNGGDGFAGALALRRLGHDCTCWAPLPSASPEAREAREHWRAAGGAIVEELPRGARFDIAVDALLGIGVTRPLGGALLAGLRWTQQQALPVVALDLPSGLNADTGEWVGGVAGADAAVTVTFLGDKPGLHLRDGLQAAGAIEVADLGVPDAPAEAPPSGRLVAPDDFAALLAARDPDVNKGRYGSVAVVGGASGMLGAALLAARAALRLGAGKVFVDCLGGPELVVDPLAPELMLQPGRVPEAGDVLVAGCGMGRSAPARARLAQWLAHPGPALFDADALNLLAADPTLMAQLAARAAPTVLTPHPGEAGRLLQMATAQVQADRILAAQRLARETRALVVLKGAGSVIAEPSGAYAVNPTGGPALSSAGTGDVLAGMTGALMAQCADTVAAVRAAVWLHGQAATLHGCDVGLVASEVAALAAQAWMRLRQRR